MRANFLFLLLGSLFLFLIHRLITFAPLLGEEVRFTGESLRFFLVGAASDAWVSLLLSLVALPLCYFKRREGKGPSFPVIFLGILAMLLLVHVSYVDFFKMPLIPQHIKYLWDFDFLRANYASSLSLAPLLEVILSGIGLFCLYYFARQRPVQTRSLILLGLCLGAAHPFNIRYKVNWFVPASLHFNLFENLAYKMLLPKAQANSSAELEELKHIYLGSQSAKESLYEVEVKSYEESATPMLARAFRDELALFKARGEKTLAIVLLVESLRAIDIAGLRLKEPKIRGLTPNLDQLSQDGISFSNAWSSGTVTRSGQEAVLCGFQSSLRHNMMRDRLDIKRSCLSDKKEGAQFFWLHGGEGRFDNQKSFWQRHGITKLMDNHDFAAEDARTGWGVSDLTFLKRVAFDLNELEKNGERGQSYLGLALTVTNHIPWHLPQDTPPEVKDFAYANIHPSEKTLRLTDFAIGQFVADLKRNSLWDNTLLIITGDHGILAPSVIAPEETFSKPEQLAHIPLIITGGIGAKVLEKSGLPRLRVEETISQIDIAPFLAYIHGFRDFSSQGELLFGPKRKRPIVADLGASIYFPGLALEVGEEELLSGNKLPVAANERQAVLYYRGFLATGSL